MNIPMSLILSHGKIDLESYKHSKKNTGTVIGTT